VCVKRITIFFDDAIVAEGLRQRVDFQIRRDVRQEFIGVELMHGCSTDPPDAVWNDEHVRVTRSSSRGPHPHL